MGTAWGPRAARAARAVFGFPPPRPAPTVEETDVWVAASRPSPEPPAPAPSSATTRGSSVPWADLEEDRRGAVLRKAGRVAVWAVVALAAVTGVRSWVSPDRQAAPASAPAPAPSASGFPVDEARVVAARFARAYLTWDAAKPRDRELAMAVDLPGGADVRQGWDQAGRQDVVDAVAGPVDDVAPGRARVRVDVLIRPLAPAAESASAATSSAGPATPVPVPNTTASPAASGAGSAGERWVSLEVPVTETGSRVVVAGPPGLLGIPAAPTVAPRSLNLADAVLSSETQDAVKGFFAAAGEGGDVAALAAPGAHVAPLPAGVAFAGLRSWAADTGGGDTRAGTAVVLWRVSGAQLEQTYRVELTRVTSAAGQRWQVSGVRGGDA
jgi:hypothetical protein